MITRGPGRAVVTTARLLAVLDCALVAAAVALPLLGGHDYLRDLLGSPEMAVAVSFSLTGALLVANESARRMGWLLLAIGTSAAVYSASSSWTGYLLGGDPTAASAATAPAALAWSLPWAAWLSSWAWFPAWLLISTVLPQVVPAGRPLPHPAWRLPLGAAYLFLALGAFAFMVTPGPVGVFEAVPNPLGSERVHGVVRPVEDALDVGVLVLLAVSLVSVLVRVVRADGVERRQVGWVGYAVAVVVLVVVLAPSGWVNLVVLLVPAGIAVAALRYRLYDLDLLVERSVVAVVLVGGAAVLYLALVGWVGAIFGTTGGLVSFAAAFAVALVFHPARIRVQRHVDRLFHGRRGDPYLLLGELDQTLREAGAPEQALVSAVRLVREGLRLPGAALEVPQRHGDDFRHADGDVPAGSTAVALELHGLEVGTLHVAPRQAGVPLADADTRVLHLLAGPLASAAYALRLSGDLAEAHRALLGAREDERRRLRRDLHDGLGPQLAGIAMGLDVVGSTLSRGRVEEAGELTRSTTALAREAVADVRRLVRGLRPPVLDELGLAAALEAAVALPGGPCATVEVVGELPDLPPAVEVAAYRIVCEAVTNAGRHAGAGRVAVRLALTAGHLRLEVHDDGAGIEDEAVAGVGLSSMRERCAELGGWCRVTSPPEGGTLVEAELPLGKEGRS